MSHTSREKLDLVNRTKKIIGQLESVLRGLNEDEHCADVLQRLAAARGAEEIGDRGEAIRTAVKRLNDGDVLLIAGKGHETGQIVGDRILPFSDQDAVRAALGAE